MYKDFDNWYVLQTRSGREPIIIDSILPYLSDKSIIKYFTKEVFHKNADKYQRKELALFPGYIFIYKHICFVENLIRKILPNEYLQIVKFEDKPCKVESNQMMLLLTCTDTKGMIPISTGFEEGDSVVITDGPLKNISCKVLFYNKKKRKVSVEFQLFQQEFVISLGVSIIKKEEVIIQ